MLQQHTIQLQTIFEPNYKAQLIERWKDLAQRKLLDRHQHMMYILLRSFLRKNADFLHDEYTYTDLESEDIIDNAEEHIEAAFTPITNKTKLENGRQPYDIPETILAQLSSNTVFWWNHILDLGKSLNVELTEIGVKNIQNLAVGIGFD